MNKILLILIMLIFASPVFAEIEAPEWEDFAPKMYEDISVEHDYRLPTHKYWRDRRIKFNESIKTCQAKYQGIELENCYKQIESLEESKNQMREQIQYEKIKQNRPMI